ncbi:MAG TPA: EamA/RhaT family transporter [Rhodanobacteraceae bacterium]|nr:EamA/RhaT family transporter [Rhodanobacteraceae bacterium]
MHFVIFSVLCSVTVSVLLKLAPRGRIDINQAIAVNYLVAAALTLWLLHPQPQVLAVPAMHRAWPALLALALLLPTMFAVLAASVRRAGVVRTDAAQRLSLLLSLLAAFTVFGELLTWQKGAGIAVGLLAIGCIVWRERGPAPASTWTWTWPLAVFAGTGVIDILFKRVALTGAAFADALLVVFALAFAISALAVIVLGVRGRARFGWRHLGGGVLLGLFNFGNILFYVRGHQALPQHPALVFSAMNIGVIALATLIGVWLFDERLNRWNRIGLVLAAVAVLAIATG